MYTKYDNSFPGLSRFRSTEYKHKIYVLIDPNDRTVRYVGQTSSFEWRRREHLGLNGRVSGSRQLREWKTSLFEVGQTPDMVIVDTAKTNLIDDLERYWISYYRSLGKLLNIQDGGQDLPAPPKKKVEPVALTSEQTARGLRLGKRSLPKVGRKTDCTAEKRPLRGMPVGYSPGKVFKLDLTEIRS